MKSADGFFIDGLIDQVEHKTRFYSATNKQDFVRELILALETWLEEETDEGGAA